MLAHEIAVSTVLQQPGQLNVQMLQGKDNTLYALIDGQVQFLFNKFRKRRSVAVIPHTPAALRPDLSRGAGSGVPSQSSAEPAAAL